MRSAVGGARTVTLLKAHTECLTLTQTPPPPSFAAAQLGWSPSPVSRVRMSTIVLAMTAARLNHIHYDFAEPLDCKLRALAGADRNRRNETPGDHDHIRFEIAAALG